MAGYYFRGPLYVVWEITHKCNAQCVHCYSDAGPDAVSDELSTAEALDVIDQLAEMGVMILGFSGGEALLRPDWRELVEHAVRNSLRVTLGSNGLTLTPEVVHDIKRLGVHNVTVSLDGANSHVHEKIRGRSGLFHAALEGIRRLISADISVTVGFTPTALNFRHGRQVVALAEKLGVGKVNLSTYVPVGRGGLEIALNDSELKWVLEEWIDMQGLYAGRIKVLWHDCRVSLLIEPGESAKYIGCGAGVVTCRITVDGKVTPCVTLLLPVGNLRQSSFRQIWNESELLWRIRNRENIVSGNCGQCEYKMTCGGCRAVSLAYYGNPYSGDRYCWIKRDNIPENPGLSLT
ncbi:MAG: radical SAM protein [Deltaproteobacteria bacterium]|nr:radical SAM protein [Deltaproteobacteria bacterium]